MWKFFLLATGEAQVVSSFVLLNIYYILWKKVKRGVSLFLNDPKCSVVVCSIQPLWGKKKSIHLRWDFVYYHFKSEDNLTLFVCKLWLKNSSKLASNIFRNVLFKLL